ncbi:MAG TPA: magnesium transporter [Gemmatimonadales bacterium]|nr:magnesium transporter [Gemmatimonadales bacterium]
MTARPGGRGGVAALVKLARAGRLDELVARARELEPPDLADVLAALDEHERLAVVQALPPELSGPALAELPEEALAGETLAALDPGRAAEIVEELPDDDAADILGELDPEAQGRILSEVEGRDEVAHLLRYDDESAGGRMTTRVVTVSESDTAAGAIDAIRRQAAAVEGFYQVFVVDRARRLVGLLALRDLVTSPADRPVREFMTAAEVRVTPEVDQEQVARLMGRYNLPSVPVVDHDGRLLGQVTFDDVIDVVEAETTEDLLKFGGVSPREELAAPWTDAVRSRLPWLYVNLVTALAAAVVVVHFSDTIERLVLLAAAMPVIAGMGGNAGIQALAVTVRRLALGLVSPREGLRVVHKEMLVGLTNGVANAVVAGAVAAAVDHVAFDRALEASIRFGAVVSVAMAGNLLVAGFAGAFVPLCLHRLRVDPAVASSIFVTTLTDMCGFFLLLGLASRCLL